MSRIGKAPILIKKGVEVQTDSSGQVRIQSGREVLTVQVPSSVEVLVKEGQVELKRKSNVPRVRAFHGLYRTLIQNAVTGVSVGWEKNLLFKGVGYKMQVAGEQLEMHLGYSHPIRMKIPKDLKVEAGKNSLTVKGADKARVGQFCAQVRSLREPEPYLGKGIRYSDEVIRRKAGKSGGDKK